MLIHYRRYFYHKLQVVLRLMLYILEILVKISTHDIDMMGLIERTNHFINNNVRRKLSLHIDKIRMIV